MKENHIAAKSQIKITAQLARELDQPAAKVENVIKLLDEGNTIPFIARYRKEAHDGLAPELR